MNPKVKRFSVFLIAFLILIALFVIFRHCMKNHIIYVDVPEWFDEVQDYMREENYDAVLDVLEDKKISNWQKVDWWYYDYAVALYKAYPEKVRYAIPMLEDAIVFSKNDSAILYHLGKCFYEVGEYGKAIEYFSKSMGKGHNDWLYFSENSTAEFWIIMLNYMKGNDSLVENLLLNSTSKNQDVEYLREIRNGNASLKDICLGSELPLEEKLLCIDFYLVPPYTNDRLSFYAEACEELVPQCDKDTANCLNSHLMSFYLAMGDVDAAENLLKGYEQYSSYIVDSESFLVNELFYKYLSFYFWKKGDAVMANNCLGIFKRYYFKPVDFKFQVSDRLENIPEFFGKNLRFKLLLDE